MSTKEAPPLPPGFEVFKYRHIYDLKFSDQAVADWLNRPETFTKGQIPPYRVEFLSSEKGFDAGFETGVYTNHHGPFLSANGVLGEIDRLRYRDLHYLYGSYVLSFRLIRPTRLEFWIERQNNEETRLTMQLTSYVRPWFRSIYHAGLKFFFSSFKQMANRGLRQMTSR